MQSSGTSDRRYDSHLAPAARRALVAQITGVVEEDEEGRDGDGDGSSSDGGRGSAGRGPGKNSDSEWVVVEAKAKATGNSLGRLRGTEQIAKERRGAAPSPVQRAIEMAAVSRIQGVLEGA